MKFTMGRMADERNDVFRMFVEWGGGRRGLSLFSCRIFFSSSILWAELRSGIGVFFFFRPEMGKLFDEALHRGGLGGSVVPGKPTLYQSSKPSEEK